MFAGHFGLAAVVKAKTPEVPIWALIWTMVILFYNQQLKLKLEHMVSMLLRNWIFYPDKRIHLSA